MCEKRDGCGFYGWLTKNGHNSDCPKPNPFLCPRFKNHNREDNELSLEVFGVLDLYPIEFPRTDEEIRIAKDLDLLDL